MCEMIFVTGSAKTVTKKVNEFIRNHPDYRINIGPQDVKRTLFGIKMTISVMAVKEEQK